MHAVVSVVQTVLGLLDGGRSGPFGEHGLFRWTLRWPDASRRLGRRPHRLRSILGSRLCSSWPRCRSFWRSLRSRHLSPSGHRWTKQWRSTAMARPTKLVHAHKVGRGWRQHRRRRGHLQLLGDHRHGLDLDPGRPELHHGAPWPPLDLHLRRFHRRHLWRTRRRRPLHTLRGVRLRGTRLLLLLKLKASKAFFPLLSQKDFFLLCGLSA